MNKYTSWALLGLRLITGIGFMVHGWAKISRGTAGFEKLLTQSGVPLPHVLGTVVPYIELLGGIAILVGLLTRFVAVILTGVMLTALFTIHINYGFSAVKTIGLNAEGPIFGPPGYEINLLYIAIFIALVLNGAGRLSVDNLVRRNNA